MFDDDENQSDSSSSSSSEDGSSTTIEGSEPPPAGDETEPAPSGESSEEAKDQPLEDVEGHSDSSAETDGSSSSSASSSSSSESSSSSDSSSSESGDSSSGERSVEPPSADDVGSCLMHACNAHDVPMDDDTVSVNLDSGLYKFAIRLSRNFNPLPKVHDDTQSLETGSVEGAGYLLQGAVQIIGDTARVTMRVVSVETSEILQASSADGSSSSSIEDAISGAAGDALAGLPLLSAT